MNRFMAGLVVSGLFAMTGWGAPARSFMEAPGAGDSPVRRPVFTWTAATDATQYLLSITRNGVPYLEKWTRKTTWAPRFDLPEGVYEVRVIGYDGAEYGQWSPKIKFRRTFAPALAAVNGLSRDGGNVQLVAGSGIEIEPVQSNLTLVIRSTGITATQLIDLAVTTEKIDEYAITVNKLADGAVTEPKLADGAVTSNKLDQAAVGEEALADGSVTEPKLADGAVTAGKIGAAAVANAKLADGAVTSNKLGNASVTAEALADGSVTSNKVASGQVLMRHIESANALTGQVLKWNGSSWFPSHPLNGYAEGVIGQRPTASGAGSVALGNNNEAYGNNSAVICGRFNVVEDDADYSSIMGGKQNQILTNAYYSIVVGGRDNIVAQRNALAAGFLASATNEGSFVWADSTGVGASSWGANTMTFMASGGVRFQSSTPVSANHQVQWKPGDASWQFSSDRNLKDGIEPVDAQAILEKVAEMPVAMWRFKGHEREHIGVMAQDFHKEFPLNGSDPTLLDSADLHGVSLAAIQALNRALQDERRKNEALEARLKALEARFAP